MTTSIYAKNSTQSAIQTNGVDSLVMDETGVVSGVDNGFKPLSAVATANTVVITMEPCSTIFRPTTLATGAPVQLSNVSPLTLTIPQGATLGSVNDVAARFIVLELNNAGTKELAVINQSGGTDLSEMGLISTTAISAGATSASVAYSTTARTSVAYRVVGCLDSTQATAGAYATALSLVQPMGGQALAAMSGFGFGQSYKVAGIDFGRSYGVTYYNTSKKPMYVYYYLVSDTISYCGVSMYIDGALHLAVTAPAGGYGVNVSGVVLPGHNYQIVVTSTPLLYGWREFS